MELFLSLWQYIGEGFGLFLVFACAAIVIFLLIRMINSMKRKEAEAPTAKDCPYCLSTIPVKATRCAHCTVDLKAA